MDQSQSQMLDKDKRTPVMARFLDPRLIVAKLNFSSGMNVAHFGCGTGYFTFPIAEKIGSEGQIYAIDVLDEKVEAVESQAKVRRLRNIVAKRANLENKDGSGLADQSQDWVIIVNMLYQNEDKNRIFMEARRILKDSGRMLLIDWKSDDKGIGPEMKSRVSQEVIIKLARKNYFGIIANMDVSHYHFGMVLEKQAPSNKS